MRMMFPCMLCFSMHALLFHAYLAMKTTCANPLSAISTLCMTRASAGTARPDARSWTEDEERLFREGLELHGRNWAAVASHIGSRDAKSVTSHTQKYLVKLCMEGRLLPPKMAESGAGYTLSGKLLDPDSASARAYGFKPATTARMCLLPRPVCHAASMMHSA